VHVRVVLVMSDEMVREMMMLIVVTGVALRRSWQVVDSLVEVRLIQFQESRRRDSHTAAGL
jgi:hypothetical protein